MSTVQTKALVRKLSEQHGQTAVEYAAVIALVAILFVGFLALVPGDLFGDFWGTVKSALP
jgi:Flp pilus assembly pilin Flp